MSDEPPDIFSVGDDPVPTVMQNPPEILVFGIGGGYFGATIDRVVNPTAVNVAMQHHTQLVLARTQEELNVRVISALIQQFRMTQDDAQVLVPDGMTPMSPTAGQIAGVATFNTRDGDVLLLTADVTNALAFTPYDAANPANYQTATQVSSSIASAIPPFASDATPQGLGTAAAGSGAKFARDDHVHPTDVSRYAASNPSGYVNAVQAAAAAPVQSFNTRSGAITLSSSDVTTALTFTPYNATNPSGFQTASQVTTALAPYALSSSVPVASSVPPTMNGPVAVGTGTTWARADHRHPVDTSRMPVMGVVDASNAVAGQVGEFLSAICLQANAITLTNNVDAVVATLALTAGDWDVWGSVSFLMTNGNGVTVRGWISPTTAQPSFDQLGGNAILPMPNNVPLASLVVTQFRVNVSTGASITLGATAAFSGTITAFGKIMARRAR